MSYTEFGKLQEIIVGNELKLNKRLMDFTFKNMYRDNLIKFDNYCTDIKEYQISSSLIEERIQDLNNFQKTLEGYGVLVHRPNELTKLENIITPDFQTSTSAANNVRDIVLAYGDNIIETPLLVRNRQFENNLLHDIFKKKMTDGSNWIKAPYTKMDNDGTLDLESWTNERDFSNIDFNSRYEMGMDAANCIKIGKDIICNVSTYNHYLGYLWLKRVLPEANIHQIKIADSHIDGSLMPLRPGVFLSNNFGYTVSYLRERLPKKFKNWDIIIPEVTESYYHEDEMYDKFNENLDFHLASSRGMDINVLSLDEKRVFTLDRAIKTQDILDKHGFEPIPIKLRHGEVFAGGLHCATLDLKRDDERIDYA